MKWGKGNYQGLLGNQERFLVQGGERINKTVCHFGVNLYNIVNNNIYSREWSLSIM